MWFDSLQCGFEVGLFCLWIGVLWLFTFACCLTSGAIVLVLLVVLLVCVWVLANYAVGWVSLCVCLDIASNVWVWFVAGASLVVIVTVAVGLDLFGAGFFCLLIAC